MGRELLNQKQNELRSLSPWALVDRICTYPDQEFLDQNADGSRRAFPIGGIARGIRDHGYEMSNKQYYTLVQHFSILMTPDLSIENVNLPDLVTLDQRLGSEPDLQCRIHSDSNLISVSAKTVDGSFCELGTISGRLPKSVSDADVTGQLQQKNGQLSIYLALDLEKLESTQGQNQGLSETNVLGYVYEMPFCLGGRVADIESANQYVKDLDYGQDLGGDFEMYQEKDSITSLTWDFQRSDRGVIRLITKEPLTPMQNRIAESFVRYQQADGGLAGRLRMDGLVQLSSRQDTFLESRKGFSLKKTIAEEQIQEEKPCISEQMSSVIITEEDLGFARQMSLSDFGMTL